VAIGYQKIFWLEQVDFKIKIEIFLTYTKDMNFDQTKLEESNVATNLI
jgi:hypothetical protein